MEEAINFYKLVIIKEKELTSHARLFKCILQVFVVLIAVTQDATHRVKIIKSICATFSQSFVRIKNEKRQK